MGVISKLPNSVYAKNVEAVPIGILDEHTVDKQATKPVPEYAEKVFEVPQSSYVQIPIPSMEPLCMFIKSHSNRLDGAPEFAGIREGVVDVSCHSLRDASICCEFLSALDMFECQNG